MSTSGETKQEVGHLLCLLCVREHDDAWRLYVRPTWVPRFLQRCLDNYGEAYPVHLDFEDLERYMSKRSVPYEKMLSTRGDVELVARGDAAIELATWLSTAIASGFRTEQHDANHATEGRS